MLAAETVVVGVCVVEIGVQRNVRPGGAVVDPESQIGNLLRRELLARRRLKPLVGVIHCLKEDAFFRLPGNDGRAAITAGE